MNSEKVSKLLKKYGIFGNRSSEETIELLEVKCDNLLERYNRTKQEELQEEINEIQDVIDYISKNDEEMSSMLTLFEEEAKTEKGTETAVAIEKLRGSSDGSKKQTSQGTSGMAPNPNSMAVSAAPKKRHFWFASLSDDKTVNNLFEQAEDCLKYGEWEKADRIFDSILAAEPKNAGVFLGKVLAKYKLFVPEGIATTDAPLESEIDFRKAVDFGTTQQAKYLNDMLVERKKIKLYKEATVLCSSGNNDNCRKAALLFEQLSGYRDSIQQASECRRKADEIEIMTKEAEKNSQIRDRATFLLKQFDDVEPGDGVRDLELLEQLHGKIIKLRDEEPLVKNMIPENVLTEMEQKITDAKEYSKYYKTKRNKKKNRMAMVLLLICLFCGVNWFYFNEYPYVTGYLPGPVAAPQIDVYEYSGKTYCAFGFVRVLDLFDCPNIEKVFVPFANLRWLRIDSENSEKIRIYAGKAEQVYIEGDKVEKIVIKGNIKEIYASSACLTEWELPDSVQYFKLNGEEVINKRGGTNEE